MNVKYLTKWLIGYRYNVVIISYSITCYFSDLREILSRISAMDVLVHTKAPPLSISKFYL